MKILVLAVLAVAAFFTYQQTIGSVKHNFNSCLETMNKSAEELKGTACSQRREVYEEAIACITVVQKEKSGATFLYGPLGVKDDLEMAVALHNEDCTHAPIEIPKEKLFL